MKRIAIIGGGIAGLSAAWSLEKARRAGQPLEYCLYEAAGRLGGVISSETIDGCVVEGGPDSFLTEKPAAAALCRELGIADQLLASNDRAAQNLHRRQEPPHPAARRPDVHGPDQAVAHRLHAALLLVDQTPHGARISFPARARHRRRIRRRNDPPPLRPGNRRPPRLPACSPASTAAMPRSSACAPSCPAWSPWSSSTAASPARCSPPAKLLPRLQQLRERPALPVPSSPPCAAACG